MSLSEVFEMLNSIPGFEGKVDYRSFPVNRAPSLPFICYLDTSTSNFFADNKVYTIIQEIDIELYSTRKDFTSEALIEAELDAHNLTWQKYEEYIPDESMYEVVYTVTVNQ